MMKEDIGNILFGKWVYRRTFNELRENIRAAHIPRNVHEYVCSSLLCASIAGIIALVPGFVIAKYLTKNNIVIFLLTVIFSVLVAYFTYYLFISYPSFKAKIRTSRIDQSMPHAITYLYALSRGGMNILDMFKSLSSYKHIYGGTAEEFALIVRDMEYFGIDIVTALNNAGTRTPSRKFKDFLGNLISVINSGGNLVKFFKTKSDYYQDTASHEQRFFLETLGLFAEVYVSALVAGPLFLIVIIVVMGLQKGGIEVLLSVIIYGVIPVGTVMFVILIYAISDTSEELPVTYSKEKKVEFTTNILDEHLYGPDEIEKSRRNEKLLRIKKVLLHPFNMLLEKPDRTLIITVPISIIYILYSIRDYLYLSSNFQNIYMGSLISAKTFKFLNIVQNYFLLGLLFIITPFTIFFELRKRKLRKLEERIPDFVKQLASMNEAGLTLTQAIEHTAESNLGVLTYEVKKIHRAISWGTITNMALLRFEKGIKSSAISRAITLIRKASESTSDIQNVLAIAAKDADMEQQLKQERFASLFIYVIIIYISFFVFLFIIVVLLVYFLAKMPESSENQVFKTSALASIKTLFYHASLLQGLCSGIVAGQMGEGNPRAGLKHSIVMLSITYIVFSFFLQGTL